MEYEKNMVAGHEREIGQVIVTSLGICEENRIKLIFVEIEDIHRNDRTKKQGNRLAASKTKC